MFSIADYRLVEVVVVVTVVVVVVVVVAAAAEEEEEEEEEVVVAAVVGAAVQVVVVVVVVLCALCMASDALTFKFNIHMSVYRYYILRVQPTRCNFSQFIYFCKTIYMFHTVFFFLPLLGVQNCYLLLARLAAGSSIRPTNT